MTEKIAKNRQRIRESSDSVKRSLKRMSEELEAIGNEYLVNRKKKKQIWMRDEVLKQIDARRALKYDKNIYNDMQKKK